MRSSKALAPLLSAALLGTVAGALGTADAAGFTVNTSADVVDAVPGDGACAAAGGACSLRAAVQEANALAGADTIQLPSGVFAFTRAGASEQAAATGDLDVGEALTITGQGAGVTVIDARGLDRAIEVTYSFTSPADLTVQDLTITGGEISDAQGGGILFGSAGIAHLEGVELRDNHVLGSVSDAIGGGVCSNGGGTLYVSGSRITSCSADRGGAIFNNGLLYVEDSTLAGNVARAGSAAVAYGSNAIYRSTLRGNRATGNYLLAAQGDSLTIEDSTLSGNADPAPLVAVSGGVLSVRNSTIAGNPAYTTIRAYSGGSVTLVDTILWNPGILFECDPGEGTITSLGHNIDSDGSCATLGSDLPAQDPLLTGLGAYGGPTATRLPRAGSPAIDTGSAAACTVTDQRGVLRPEDGDGTGGAQCDIGAIEVPEPRAAALGAAAVAALLACARRGR